MSFGSFLYTLLIRPLQLLFEVIFSFANQFFSNPGITIVFLSLAINILVLPLYMRADAIQEQERDIQAKLAKGVAHIKKTFKGDERMLMLQTYYRQNNYKPTYALRGATSLLLEIPFFIAAYRFLSTLPILDGVSFGPIADLSKPDAMLTVGSFTINVLPFIMTAVNFVSSAIFTKGYPLKTKIQLYGMAVFFLVFLYTSPAGLVFYWTLNNLFSLIKTLFYKLKHAKQILAVLTALVGAGAIYAGITLKDSFSYKYRIAFALVGVALFAPLAVLLIKKFAHLKPRQKTEAIPTRRLFFVGTLFMTVLVGLVIPSTYIAASPQEYVDIVYFHNPLWYIVSAAAFAAGTFLIWFNVFYSLADKRIKVLFERAIWCICLVATVDYLFFGKKLGNISSTLRYDKEMFFASSEQLINLLVVVGVIALGYLIIKKSPKLGVSALLISALALGCMSGYNIVKSQKSVSELTSQDYVTGDTLSRISRTGDNVIVLMLDRALNEYMPFIFNEKPELKKQFEGFTVYDNTISFSPCTKYSTPSLFGGYEYTPVELNRDDERAMVEKHNEALKMMPKLFADNGFEVTVCNPPYAGYGWIPDLSVFDDIEGVKAVNTSAAFDFMNTTSKDQEIENNKRNFFCFSIMKVCPVFVQNALYDGGQYRRIKGSEEEAGGQVFIDVHHAQGIEPRFRSNVDILKNFPSLIEITDENVNTMMYMVNETTHAPTILQMPDYYYAETVNNEKYDAEHKVRYDENGRELVLETEEQFKHYHINMAAMIQLGNWFDYLRKENVFDNTRIILISDHGWGKLTSDDTVLIEGTSEYLTRDIFYPIFMVKDLNSNDEYKTDSTLMTIADVPTEAVKDLIANPKNPYTGKAIDSSEKTRHDQYIVVSFDKTENPNDKTLPASPWAKVAGDADSNDLSNWTLYKEPQIVKDYTLK